MDEAQAVSLAKLLGGEPWQSGGDIWIVVIRKADKKIIAITDDVICEYENEEALEAGEPENSIVLA